MKSLNEICTSLFSAKKLDRDQGVNYLNEFLSNSKSEETHAVEQLLLKHLNNISGDWESKHGSLLACKTLIVQFKQCGFDHESEEFLQAIYKICLELLTDSEVRIRLAAGEVLGSLCFLKGPEIYGLCNNFVLQLIKDNLERDAMDTSSAFGDDSDSSDSDKVLSSPKQRVRRLSSDASQIFHDTAGWKCLETSMKCLQFMVEGCGEDFKSFITNDLLELLFKTLSHTNRFVRETGYYVLGSLVSCGFTCEESSYNPFSADNFGHQISKQLGIGLSDNWSQVRLASSECARKFLLSFNTNEERQEFYAELLPQMCLNRYYIADGVRIYSQESWRRVVNENGRTLVKKYINQFVKHYIAQTKADNHAVREAACACIAELASKVDREATKPFVSDLLQSLLDCFGDDSWPVRDAACLACGNFVLCYPEECREFLDKLLPLFFANLGDAIPSVRQGAAGALANVIKAYGRELFCSLEIKITDSLKDIKNQPSESEKYGQLDKGPATFGVVKRLRDNDMELHTNQTMYSCGSLAPKMGRGGGCSDHKFRKPTEPWELADGCVHLLAELSQLKELTPDILKMLPLLHEVASKKHYTHHVCILESLCKQLPNICRGIGVQKFKMFLEIFLDDIFYSLTCENILTSTAASDCLKELSALIGPKILRGRVESYCPQFKEAFCAAVGMNPLE